MNYDDWKTESPEDEEARLNRTFGVLSEKDQAAYEDYCEHLGDLMRDEGK